MRQANQWSRLLFSLIFGVGLGLAVLLSMNAGVIPTQARTDAQQAELHVCPVGCVYTNVQAAVDAANPGDVIKVAGGVYEGVLTRAGLRQMVYILSLIHI
ncbi:MAG: hypothetical protein N2508_10655, partial [Anaerolineae bacterium]|nr:hypothetical protein [Anaerolineae bacterium]